MKRRPKTMMLALDNDDPEKELEFEVQHALTLTPKQRYRQMERLLRMGKRLGTHDRKITPSIVARP